MQKKTRSLEREGETKPHPVQPGVQQRRETTDHHWGQSDKRGKVKGGYSPGKLQEGKGKCESVEE